MSQMGQTSQISQMGQTNQMGQMSQMSHQLQKKRSTLTIQSKGGRHVRLKRQGVRRQSRDDLDFSTHYRFYILRTKVYYNFHFFSFCMYFFFSWSENFSKLYLNITLGILVACMSRKLTRVFLDFYRKELFLNIIEKKIQNYFI